MSVKNLENAPVVYFDNAPAFGVMDGIIQIELAAGAISVGSGGEAKLEFVSTARIRCSPAAAARLRDTLDKSLQMLAKSHDQCAAVAANRPH
jgi:hypothetical protein